MAQTQSTEPLTSGRSQNNHRTKITTVLDRDPQYLQYKTVNEDPLLCAMVQCSEAISAPYYIDVMMYANRELEIKPKQMINTPATVYVRVEERGGMRHQPENFAFTYQKRKGVFQNFVRQDRFHRRIGDDYNVYAGRIVPSFLIMDLEVRNRIFEKRDKNGVATLTFFDVLDECMSSFKPLNMQSYVNKQFVLEALKGDNALPPMDHCVQYGESTYNFLSRLMNRFSFWYYFSHEGDGDQETMVLGLKQVGSGGFPKCTLFENYPDRRDPENNILVENWQQILGLSHNYNPAPRRSRTSDFNTVISTQPIQSADTNDTAVISDFDIINPSEGSIGASSALASQTNYVLEQFPDSTIYKDDDATDDAKETLSITEGNVFAVSAVNKNPTFVAGKKFKYMKYDDNKLDTEYAIARLSFNAYDRGYLYIINRQDFFGLAGLLDDVFVGPSASFVAQFGAANTPGTPDFATAMAAAGLQESINNSIENATSTYPIKPGSANYSKALQPSTPSVGTYFAAGMVGYLASFLPNTSRVLQDLLVPVEALIKVLSILLEGIVQTILLPANLLGQIFFHHNLGKDVDQAFNKVTEKLDRFVEHLLLATDVDAYSGSFIAIPLDKGLIGPPIPVARNAQIFGPHLATVIGPDGVDISSGEIWADKVGRVRVRFPWDRLPSGAGALGDLQPDPAAKWTDDGAKNQYRVGTNTAWVRVSDAWGGQRQFGTQFLPRIGDEVIVSFIDGDPDRPIITGRVYNMFLRDSNLPLPNPNDTTPIENMKSLLKLQGSTNWSQSGLRTRILKQTGANTKYHLLRFDDNPDHMQYLLRSQGRMDVTVMGTYYNSTHRDYNLTIGGQCKPPGLKCGGTFLTQVYKNYNLHIGKNNDGAPPAGSWVTEVAHDCVLTVGTHTEKGDYTLNLMQDWNAQVARNMTVSAIGPTSEILINSLFSITLQVGQNLVLINPTGIFLQSASVISLQAAAISLQAPVIASQVPVVPVGPVTLLFPMTVVPPLSKTLPTDPTAADPGDTFQQSK